MPKITTFLTFKSKGKEAVNLYTSVFDNSKFNNLMLMPGSDQLIYASFSLDGQEFMAMDGGDYFQFEEGTSLFVTCKDQEEVDYYWEKLTANGGQPGRCGWLKDPFGVSWQIVPTVLGELMGGSTPEQAGRVHDAMMKMNKIIVSDLQEAFKG